MDALNPAEVRVLACLVEKAATVPDAYPLTGNALRQACNQTTSRDPVVAYDELTVQRSLDSLKAAGLVRFVHPAHGERATRFRHVVDERLGLDPGELAAVAVLALRGPQTAAEVRTRAERMHAFGDVEQAEATLSRLADRDEPLVVALPRRRWAHLLGGLADVAHADQNEPPEPRRPGSERISALEAEVADLRERLERLEQELGVQLPS